MQAPSIPKGTRDFSPEMMFKRNYLLNKIKAVFEKFGFQPLETPCMENLDTLTGKYGDEGDQLLFKVLNSGDFLSKTNPEDYASGSKAFTKKIAEKGLRYDLTVPFARYVVKNRGEITFPFKRYQVQPVWRADRPQKGRYREFFQCDADVVGTKSLLCEMEIVQMITEAYRSLGLKDYSIKVNNRKILTGISEYLGQPGKESELCVSIDKLDKIGQDKVFEELVQKGFEESALSQLTTIFSLSGTNEDKLDQIAEILSNPTASEGANELKEIINNLKASGSYESAQLDIDVTLARGLSYYTGTIFEVKPTSVKMGTITAGGRYDNLTGVFGLPDVSGVGISFGVDRIYDVMEELKLFPEENLQSTQLLIVNFGDDVLAENLKLLKYFRDNHIKTEIFPEAAKMKKQFNYANKKNIPFVVMAGSDEIENQKFVLRNMKSGDQESLSQEDIVTSVLK